MGLARMTDKARGHHAELIGDFKYGLASGNDADLLAFLQMTEEAFLELAIVLPDDELAEKVVAEDKENAAANGAEKKKSADPDMEEEAYMAAKLACSLANKDDCVMCGA